MRLGFFEKLWMLGFLKENQNNPERLAEHYRKNPEMWEALKKEFPDWEKHAKQLPNYKEMREKLRELGVPV